MIFDLSNNTHLSLFNDQVNFYKGQKCKVKLTRIAKKRTLTQNKALHKWFEFIANELNNLGLTFRYSGLKDIDLEVYYSSLIVKEFIIKPIINTMFGIDSTTKLDTEKINKLIDIINKFFAKKEIYLPFPSIESLINYYEHN